jgi:cytochrome c oxidase assembly protein subunit 15
MQSSAIRGLSRRGASLLRHVPKWVYGRTAVKRCAVVTSIGMFLVLAMGTLVTNTNSQRGCGQSWPLCNGKFIPDFAVSTLIEYSHRVVVGPETLLVLLTTAGVLYYWRARKEIRILAPAMVIFLFAQAALGAAAVKFPESPEILALHFGVSLLSFVSILLTTIFIHELNGWDRLRDVGAPTAFRRLVFGVTIYTYLVVYTGAYVRHRHVELACGQWPACNNGQLAPGFSGAVGIVFTHRVAAFVLTLATVWLVVWARRLRATRPDLYRGSVAALAAVLLQALDGAYVVISKVGVISALLHAALVALLFGALCYLWLKVLARPSVAVAATPPTARVAQEPAPSAGLASTR